ncbi:MAG: hypothetical protein MZV65_20920, partial [Chromatiales bacterium]|nr:hypothetical protein [Chromatiales bacterium]
MREQIRVGKRQVMVIGVHLPRPLHVLNTGFLVAPVEGKTTRPGEELNTARLQFSCFFCEIVSLVQVTSARCQLALAMVTGCAFGLSSFGKQPIEDLGSFLGTVRLSQHLLQPREVLSIPFVVVCLTLAIRN